MKVICTKTTTIEFDLNKERVRINQIFNKKKNDKKYRESLLNVIDVFERDGLHKAIEAYDDLPYHEEDEYPLQESMGIWWWQINGNEFLYKDNVKEDYKIEIIKTEV
jgi:hypothetical protein